MYHSNGSLPATQFDSLNFLLSISNIDLASSLLAGSGGLPPSTITILISRPSDKTHTSTLLALTLVLVDLLGSC